MDLVLTYVKEITEDIKIKGSLGCSSLDVFVILKNMDKEWSQGPELHESELWFFKELLDEMSSKKFLGTKECNKPGCSLRMPA